MYGSHDMRHTGFHTLTVVNGHPGFGASQSFYVMHCLQKLDCCNKKTKMSMSQRIHTETENLRGKSK